MDALIDTVKMLPFLYLACLAIEAIEHSHGDRIEQALAGGGRWGFAAGAVLGCIPQCGFSAMAANLYGGRVITLGTLMAVFGGPVPGRAVQGAGAPRPAGRLHRPCR